MSRPATSALVRRLTRRLRVYVGSHHVAVDVLARSGRRLHRTSEAFGADADFESVIRAAGNAVTSVRAASGDLRGVTCDIVVADRWLLYGVVALDIAEVPPQGAKAAVAATLADVAGTRAAGLEVSWQWQGDGLSALAMAIPGHRLDALRTALSREGVSIRSVTGELVAVFNEHRRTLSGPRVVLAVNRASGAQVALMMNGAIFDAVFDAGCTDATRLVRAATNAMRARGEDTTAEITYVVDAGDSRDSFDVQPAPAGRWTFVRTPDWAAVA